MSKRKRIIFCVILAIILSLLIIKIYTKKENSKACISENDEYILGGEAVGIKLLATGVLVMGVERQDVDIKVGDIILEANDQKIETDAKLEELAKNGEALSLTIKRDDKLINTTITPQFSNNSKEYKLGLWVKDSSAGVGTITFYDKNNLYFASLGHAIYESSEENILPITSGCITKTEIYMIKKGVAKSPGELKGTITNDIIGQIYINSKNGVVEKNDEINYSQIIKVAKKEEIEEGEAYIYVTLDDNIKKRYKIQIEKIFLTSTDNKNMVIKITDPELIEKTGGIVQGMSGAPIVQNGKLIGCVTHVLVDNPQLGYAAFIENMLNDINQL